MRSVLGAGNGVAVAGRGVGDGALGSRVGGTAVGAAVAGAAACTILTSFTAEHGFTASAITTGAAVLVGTGGMVWVAAIAVGCDTDTEVTGAPPQLTISAVSVTPTKTFSQNFLDIISSNGY